MSDCNAMKYLKKGRYAVCILPEKHEMDHQSFDGITWKQVPQKVQEAPR